MYLLYENTDDLKPVTNNLSFPFELQVSQVKPCYFGSLTFIKLSKITQPVSGYKNLKPGKVQKCASL